MALWLDPSDLFISLIRTQGKEALIAILVINYWFLLQPHSRESRTYLNFNYQKLFLVKRAVPHPTQRYNSVSIIAMNTDGHFAWSVFVQLLHHQNQLWFHFQDVFLQVNVWVFVSRWSCWQDLTRVVCNWTLRARLTAVKPFNVCHRQIWEFLRCRVKEDADLWQQCIGWGQLLQKFLQVGLASSRVQGPSPFRLRLLG